MAKKKKLLTAVAAVATAAAVMLGGTFAWQSISQTALNEASDVINPGGRLHDDFYIDDNGDYNADIYVENFAEDPIIARVKLSEYMEVVINQGVEGAEIVDTIVGSKSLEGEEVTDKATDNTSGYTYEYVTHYFDQENLTDSYWNWTMGSDDSSEVWYMPTFNMNKDSLVADRNGMYVDRIGGISNRSQGQYEDWTVWTDGDEKTGDEIWDVDSNQVDEVGYDFENLQTYVDADNIALSNETHEAKPVGSTSGLISMQEWIDNGAQPGDYWVYDTDGWVYWAQLIPGGETTGLLLDAIELDNVMDDTWYYAIEATGQFVTPDDIGKDDGTGFYADGEAPSSNAEILLEEIGADVSGETNDPQTYDLYLNYAEDQFVNAKHGDYIILSVEESYTDEESGETTYGDLSSVTVYDDDVWEPLTAGEDYTYDPETKALIITDESVSTALVYDGSGLFGGYVYLSDDGSEDEDDNYYNTIEIWHEDSDTLRGGEFLLFNATVYDDMGDPIAYTDKVTFSVEEVGTDDVATVAMFDTTYMDGNALFVADDISERGVKTVLVTASYTDQEDGTEYTGEYELHVRPGDSPLKIGMTLNGKELSLPAGEDTYQMFPHMPSEDEYRFSAKYNDSAVSTTWSIEPDDSWYTVGVESDGYCYAYAVVTEDDPETEDYDELNYDWTPEGAVPVKTGDKVARIHTTTGEFDVLIGETFPYTMTFSITAEYEVDGQSLTNTVYLFLGRVVANFHVLNADEDQDSVDSHYATYTKDQDSTIKLAFDLTLNGEEAEVNVEKLYDCVLREGDYGPGGDVIDSSKYTITTDPETNTATLTIPAGSIDVDELSLEVKYNHGVKGPRTPEGISTASLSITESSAASTGDGEVDYLTITDYDTGLGYATYTEGVYQKIRLEAAAYTADDDGVYSGSVVWAITGNPANVQLKQDGFTAEVWLLKASEEEITINAYYYKENGDGIHKNANFTITAESDNG